MLVFSKEKFIRDMSEAAYLESMGWVDELDGVKVDLLDAKSHFYIARSKQFPDDSIPYIVHGDWCIEVNEGGEENA